MRRTEDNKDSRNIKIQVLADHVTGAGDVPCLLTYEFVYFVMWLNSSTINLQSEVTLQFSDYKS